MSKPPYHSYLKPHLPISGCHLWTWIQINGQQTGQIYIGRWWSHAVVVLTKLSIFVLQVEDAWKGTEFIVFPHRDSKDVFILGSTDDIQVTLDDSIVSCQMWKCSSPPPYPVSSYLQRSFSLFSLRWISAPLPVPGMWGPSRTVLTTGRGSLPCFLKHWWVCLCC